MRHCSRCCYHSGKMSTTIQVTPGLAGRTSRTETIVTPGAPLEDSIVLALSSELAAWPAEALRKGVWIVVGDGQLPSSAAPFLRLGDGATNADLESAVNAAIEVLHLRRRVAVLTDEARCAKERQLDLARVGIGLSAEHDLDRLLELILSTARELVAADAGSLYLVEGSGEEAHLRFVLAQNDSLPAGLAGATVPLDSTSLAGFVAQHGEPVTVEDVRHLPDDLPYRTNSRFDLATGYHSRSVLTVPVATRSGEVIGVLQLINRKINPGAKIVSEEDADRFVRPFGTQDVAVIRSLAGQAAVAIENSRLVQEIERLFESFVRASVTAIEQRDPSTSGHSLRVAHYAVSLARAVEQNPPATLRGCRFDRDALTQLRYAALLHDFGKVGVREAVLTKGKKLYPERLARVHERFLHAARAREARILRTLLERLYSQRRPPGREDLEALEGALREMRSELDAQLEAVLAANEPTVLEASVAAGLAAAANASFPGEEGENTPLLLPDEIRVLSVRRGSLDEEERLEVESHVVHTFQFLLTIPWPSRYRRVPEIAYGHHEKLNGRGYPNRLKAEQIPVEVRMMTICDIYDALAAGDRPYKRAVSPAQALAILEDETKSGALDPDLVRVFIDGKIYTRVKPADAILS